MKYKNAKKATTKLRTLLKTLGFLTLFLLCCKAGMAEGIDSLDQSTATQIEASAQAISKTQGNIPKLLTGFSFPTLFSVCSR